MWFYPCAPLGVTLERPACYLRARLALTGCNVCVILVLPRRDLVVPRRYAGVDRGVTVFALCKTVVLA